MRVRTPKVGEVWSTADKRVAHRVVGILNSRRMKYITVKGCSGYSTNNIHECNVNDFMNVLLPPEEREVPEILYNKE